TRSQQLMDEYYRRSSLFSLEQELLFAAATLQAVAYLEHPMLLNVVKSDYERACWSLSSGTRRDVLGVCGAILEQKGQVAEVPERQNTTFARVKRLAQSAGV